MRMVVTIDCADASVVVPFWRDLLGYVPGPGFPDAFDDRRYYSLVDPAGRLPTLVFQVVPDAPSGKGRVHLDLHLPGIEEAAARVVALGGTRLDATPIREVGESWIRCTDPEGTVLCLIEEPDPQPRPT